MKQLGSKMLVVGVGLGVLALGSTVLARPPGAEPPASTPFATSCVITSIAPNHSGTCSGAVVPAGFRFEIHTVTAGLQIHTAGIKPIHIHAQISTNGAFRAYYFPTTFQADNTAFTGDFYTMNQMVLLHADGGTAPLFTVGLSDDSGASVDISASGMLVPE